MSQLNIPTRAGLTALVLLAMAFFDGLAAQARDDHLVGQPKVVDGDTLDFAGNRVELSHIDALEDGQTCGTGVAVWNCGMEARWALLNRIGRHWVTCVPEGPADAAGLRATCYLAGVGQHDVGAWLVAQGWALADRQVGDTYVAEEAAAQAARRGMWRGVFEAPWDWRRARGSQ